MIELYEFLVEEFDGPLDVRCSHIVQCVYSPHLRL